MYRDRKRQTLILSVALLTAWGCEDDKAGVDPGQTGQQAGSGGEIGGSGGEAGGQGGQGGADAGPPPFDPEINPEGTVPVRASTRAQVKFKGGERWARDLAKGLEISTESMCKELGQYDCVDAVHRIALGGVEPYRLGINNPLPVAPVTAAIAVDRVALSACDVRVSADLAAGAEAVIYIGLSGDERPEQATLEAAAATLYDRVLRRDPDPDEVASLIAFYEDGMTPRDWALGTCFAVASSMEALFY